MITAQPHEILDFWFGRKNDDASTAEAQAKLWWSKDIEIDTTIRTRYAGLVDTAAQGLLSAWQETPQGELARIILLDQFPRNIYRGTPRSFAYDAQALTWSLEGLARRSDQALRPVERVFFYLPLEHAEDLDHQERSVALFRRLRDEVPLAQRPTFVGFLDYANRHRDIVARFGRFPHRNAVLGRTSTPAEEAFLSQPGSSF